MFYYLFLLQLIANVLTFNHANVLKYCNLAMVAFHIVKLRCFSLNWSLTGWIFLAVVPFYSFLAFAFSLFLAVFLWCSSNIPVHCSSCFNEMCHWWCHCLKLPFVFLFVTQFWCFHFFFSRSNRIEFVCFVHCIQNKLLIVF